MHQELGQGLAFDNIHVLNYYFDNEPQLPPNIICERSLNLNLLQELKMPQPRKLEWTTWKSETMVNILFFELEIRIVFLEAEKRVNKT